MELQDSDSSLAYERDSSNIPRDLKRSQYVDEITEFIKEKHTGLGTWA